jgi:hypothetical protein
LDRLLDPVKLEEKVDVHKILRAARTNEAKGQRRELDEKGRGARRAHLDSSRLGKRSGLLLSVGSNEVVDDVPNETLLGPSATRQGENVSSVKQRNRERDMSSLVKAVIGQR